MDSPSDVASQLLDVAVSVNGVIMRKTGAPTHDALPDTMAYLQCSRRRLSCWVPNSGTLLGTGNVNVALHFPYIIVAPYVLKSLVFRRFWHEKRASGFLENPTCRSEFRTLEPLNTTNTLAGCPYRPLRHDSTVALRRNSM